MRISGITCNRAYAAAYLFSSRVKGHSLHSSEPYEQQTCHANQAARIDEHVSVGSRRGLKAVCRKVIQQDAKPSVAVMALLNAGRERAKADVRLLMQKVNRKSQVRLCHGVVQDTPGGRGLFGSFPDRLATGGQGRDARPASQRVRGRRNPVAGAPVPAPGRCSGEVPWLSRSCGRPGPCPSRAPAKVSDRK
jgi:hypothetical protein